jgi:hypothetical protein
MGCGCAKKMAAIKARKNKRKAAKNGAKVVRKKRVSKLVSIPGRSVKRKVKKS